MSILNKIDHIGIAVSDLNRVIEFYRLAFALEPSFIEEVEEQQVRVAGFTLGESTVEYLEPLHENSPISKFLFKRGNGIHHVAYSVKNLDEVLRNLKNLEFQLIDEMPRSGAGGKKIAFIHPKSSNGILFELCELPGED